MKKYQPSNEAPLNGILLLIAIGTVGGLLLGGIMYAISKLVYLILIFPLLFGIAGGYLASFAITKGKIRHPLLAFTMAALIGILIFATYNFAEFNFFKQGLYEVLKADPELSHVCQTLNPDQAANIFLTKVTGSPGFWGFMKYQAKIGITITKVSRPSSRGIELNETFTWIYFLVELLIFAGVSGAMAFSAASEPFCERCDNWYGKKKYVDSTYHNKSEQLLWALNRGDYTNAGKLLDLVPHDYPRVDMAVQQCPSCQEADLYVELSLVSKNRKGQIESKKLATGLISPSDFQTILESRVRPTETTDNYEESADTEIKEIRYEEE